MPSMDIASFSAVGISTWRLFGDMNAVLCNLQGGFLPAVNSQLGFHVKGHVPTIKEAEESRDTLTQWGHQWRISSGDLQVGGLIRP